MDAKGNPIERAYELARMGKYGSTSEIAKQLKHEGYDGVESHLAGAGIRRELASIARDAGGVSKSSLRWQIKKRAGL